MMKNNLVAIGFVVGMIPLLASAQVSTQKPVVSESVVRGDDGKVVLTVPEKPTNEIDMQAGPKPQWIWRADKSFNNDRIIVTKTINVESVQASLSASCDNSMVVSINGKKVLSDESWESASDVSIQKYLKPGANHFKFECNNEGSVAGLVIKLGFKGEQGKVSYVISDSSWFAAKYDTPDQKTAAVELGPLGRSPWGNVLSGRGGASAGLESAVPNGVFQLPEGFQVEELYTVPKGEQGSWVSIAFDNKGRLIASDQGGKGLYRITLPAIGTDEETRVQKLNIGLSSAQGMLYAFDSLYVSVNGGPGSGFYRLQDTTGDDQFDKMEKLAEFRGGGEHGPHSVRLGPDGKSIYVIAGNHTDPPTGFSSSTIPTNWSEDLLLPRQWDARGHAAGKLAPGGWIARTNAQGKDWEMFSIGYRNPYDFDFNADGEIFAYDADMEWDMGTPWYRPTRVVHATSGSEFGWRSGTGKWPAYYGDSLPQAVDIGPGSPVGACFGYGTKFPAKYQKGFYCLDWTFGTMYIVHSEAEGASYKATREEFLSRSPLPLTDAAVGPDGALYFSVGGRGTQSALFRVTYIGKESTSPVDARDKKFAKLRELRRSLEAFHGKQAGGAVEAALASLGHEDRHVRYAARVALEFQPVDQWVNEVLVLDDAAALINGVMAIARQGDEALQTKAINALLGIGYDKLTKQQQLDLLRAYSLVFIRLGEPDVQTAGRVLEQLDDKYPAGDIALDRELVSVLVYLNSSTVAGKTLKLMAADEVTEGDQGTDLLTRNRGYGGTIAAMLNNRPEIQKIHYAYALRNLRYGWTIEQRKEYLQWFVGANERSGGASYSGFLKNIQSEALANMSDDERKLLAGEAVFTPPKEEDLPKPLGPGKVWDLGEVIALADKGLSGRNFDNGKKMFAAAKCLSCHRFDGNGGSTGPDLSNVAGRFSNKDLAEAIIHPSKVISDQYRAMNIVTVNGKVLAGRVTSETEKEVTVLTDPVDATKLVTLAKDDIDEMLPSKQSLMPEKLLNTLNKEEVLDLLAFLKSRGNPNAIEFK
ncbi:MAG: heme-binding protein [Planctomycetaceae bacterium]|nr:heme-binding protein [Planctomycetaceae bacterium]